MPIFLGSPHLTSKPSFKSEEIASRRSLTDLALNNREISYDNGISAALPVASNNILALDKVSNGAAGVVLDISKTEESENIAAINEKIARMQMVVTDSLQSSARTDIVEKPLANDRKIISSGEFAGSYVVKSEIKSNFYADARKNGIPAKVVDKVIHTLSSKVNFRRSLKKGDAFEIMYSKNNELLYAKISTKHGSSSVFGMMIGKKLTYFFENGESVERKRTVVASDDFGSPLSGKLKISDPFGYRRHPITGKYSHHSGVDLRASYGTPVYAVMSGIVTRASYFAGYGYCVDIKHRSGYSSRYAHLSKFATKAGASVKKGQLIGFVGSTGQSTGAHLHLELAKNNQRINPLGVKMVPGSSKVKYIGYSAPAGRFKTFKNKIKKAVEHI